MTPIPTELRELMEHIVSIGPTDYETMYRAKAQLKYLLATPPADAANMGGQAGEEVPHQITIVQHLDIKGSRKALGAMNAKLRCKVGHLERKISEQCEELEILHKQLDRFRDGSHGIPALAEHERLSQELAQHRQQAGKLVEALREIRGMRPGNTFGSQKCHEQMADIADEALAAWDVKP